MNFKTAVDFIIDLEGGYINHSSDPGGETKYGISKKSYPDLNIGSLTIGEAKEIYKRDFWDKISGDLLPQGLSLLVFDAAINHGEDLASIMLQRMVRTKPDGQIGPVTLEAMQGMNKYALVEMYSLERLRHYQGSKNWEVFGKGWSKRLLIVSLKATEIIGNNQEPMTSVI